MQKNNNFLIWLALVFLLMTAYVQVGNYFWPPPQKKPVKSGEESVSKIGVPDPQLGSSLPAQIAAGWQQAPAGQGIAEAVNVLGRLAVAQWSAGMPMRVAAAAPPRPAPAVAQPKNRIVHLGDDSFNLKVKLDTYGAGVRQIILNYFQEADVQGRPVWSDQKHTAKTPLELVPEPSHRGISELSYLLYHYGPDPAIKANDRAPKVLLDTLGKVNWELIEPAKIDPQQVYQRVVFQTQVDGVRITKIYTLSSRAYHIGLEVKLELDPRAGTAKKFHYQLTSAHGLPIEGQWYTSTFRNALIGKVNQKGYPDRNLQDLRTISFRGGGDEVLKGNGSLRYAGVAVQYFASVVAVDDEQENKDFLTQARPILTTQAVKGHITKLPKEGNETFTLTGSDKSEYVFQVNPAFVIELAPFFIRGVGAEVVVVYQTVLDKSGQSHLIAKQIKEASRAYPLFLDDITVGVSTDDKLELKPGQSVVHKYLLYNGPVKVSQLHQLVLDHPVNDQAAGSPAVPPELVERYLDKLYLNTLTDFHSPGWAGEFASTIYWSDLLIKCTNLMHGILGLLHALIPNYGICIILLTVLVRGLMFPISRRGTMNALRMQQIAPEMKKLQEKYKNDRQGLAVAQMDLYRKHGVNPLGSCWLIFLQMPVFMGLYYALQESIHFRLAPFLWIENLAAPDMLISWSSSIPWISRPEDYGSFLYLGPYFNLLPVVAVSLMLIQQNLTMPPPADENQATQQKTMKYMMIFFGLMFYKVAAGLCLYFIASNLWGFAERKLLPKRKPEAGEPSQPQRPSLLDRAMARLGTLQTRANGPANGLSGNAPSSSLSSSALAPLSTSDASGLASSDALNRGKRKRKRDRRPNVGTAALGTSSAASPGSERRVSGEGQSLRSWWEDLRRGSQRNWEKLRAWWVKILKQAEKR